MSGRKPCALALVAALLIVGAPLAARGDMLASADVLAGAPAASVSGAAVAPSQFATVSLFERSGTIQGTQSHMMSIGSPGAGTLRVTLTDLVWPNAITGLSFALTSASATLGRMNTPGTAQFEVTGPAALFAQVSGTASGPFALGMYSLRVEFTPIPLPPAVLLLLTALMAFGRWLFPGLRAGRDALAAVA